MPLNIILHGIYHSALLSQNYTFGLHCGVWGVDCAARQGYNVSIMAPCERWQWAWAEWHVNQWLGFRMPCHSGFPIYSRLISILNGSYQRLG